MESPTPSTAFQIPALLLREAQGHVVSVESTDSKVYRGRLEAASDTMNLTLGGEVLVTDTRGGRQSSTGVFLRGSQVKMVVLPDFLEDAPHFAVLRARRQQRAVEEVAASAAARGASKRSRSRRKRARKTRPAKLLRRTRVDLR
ncbi:hypothetical protein CDCA_CDCA10G2965 [Cyanidium caldarium]|uniref:Sm domain-containing protein n=1 Tax=Cyanidium caldarium TaxID=2771 RepID=A0AAV9IXX4_CYACA|nr:hypothetical protein CDCA_CDCA10G2965 [Cyanidium caldarium]